MKKLLYLLLCLCLTLPLLACGGDTAPNESQAETQPEVAEPAQMILAENGVTSYEVVYPLEALPADGAAAYNIQKAFEKATGASIKRHDDFLKKGQTHAGEKYRILVGHTNYPQSEELYEGLRYQDYRVTVKGDFIAVAAYTDAGYAKAIEWLQANVFAEGENGRFTTMEQSTAGCLVEKYNVAEWTVDGTSIAEFSIIYKDHDLKETVESFRDEIAVKTGFYLPVYSTVKMDPTAHEILVGNTGREESELLENPGALKYTIAVRNGKLLLEAGGEHSMIELLDVFLDKIMGKLETVTLTNDTTLKGDMFDDPYIKPMPENADIRVISANVLAQFIDYGAPEPEDFAFERRLEIFLGMLEFYEPTVVGMQEFCKTWFKGVKQYDHMDKWELLEFANPNVKNENVASTIMFRKDLLTLVDSGMQYYSIYNNGRCRCITWAVLKVNATGEEFCFVSTHWDGSDGDASFQNAQVEELSEFVLEKSEKYPVITTGDFNANEKSAQFTTYLRNIKSIDAMHQSGARLNKVGSWHGWGETYNSANSIDHITVPRSCRSLQFETLVYNEQIYASDHAWLLADVDLNP